jgi:hypothetical protein
MKLDLKHSWSVRVDIPKNTTTLGEPCQTYRKHLNLIVYAPTLERALAVVRADAPEATVWAINHANADAIILSETAPTVENEGGARDE